jgi:hypothetical protein
MSSAEAFTPGAPATRVLSRSAQRSIRLAVLRETVLAGTLPLAGLDGVWAMAALWMTPWCAQHRSGQSVNYKFAQFRTSFIELHAVLGPSQRAIAGENTSRITVSGWPPRKKR